MLQRLVIRFWRKISTHQRSDQNAYISDWLLAVGSDSNLEPPYAMTSSMGNDTKTESYSYPFADLADERTQDWPLVKSPWNIIALLALYLLMVRYAPKWTARWDRVQAFAHPLQTTSAGHSVFQMQAAAVESAFVLSQLGNDISQWLYLPGVPDGFTKSWLQLRMSGVSGEPWSTWNPGELAKQLGIEKLRIRNLMQIAAAMWWFYISKILEFVDTAFFILRHKWNQLSFLHVYHHSTMFLFCWTYVKWLPTGSSEFIYLKNIIFLVVIFSYSMQPFFQAW